MILTLLEYQITSVITQEGITCVYRGVARTNNQPVILKTVRLPPTERQLARLRHEYAVLTSLDNPGVPRPIDLIDYQGALILVQEDIGGVPLTGLISAGPCLLERFFPIARALVTILDHIHRRQIIHRDLKPSNIILNPYTGQLQIIDFGLASRLSREHPQLAAPTQLEGTLAYLAPEQTGRMNRVVDYRADFYALGITLYELLTGQLPFVAHDALEWTHCHIARQPRDPAQLVPNLPKPLIAIILKLLAKLAEDRYQSAAGLQADLLDCQRQWLSIGAIAPFSLGAADTSDRLQIPQRLYGRDQEAATLFASFTRVAAGAPAEVVLVTGYAGIGKSSLVAELYKPIVAVRGTFVSGKFGQFERGVPYAALISAFQSLIQQVLSEQEQRIGVWRQRLLDALGSDAQVICDLMPQLALLIGTPAAVAVLPPDLAQYRLHRTFEAFVRVFAQPDHPLVLFVDDLQWADSDSLTLLTQLLVAADIRYLFFIGAYRDSEVLPDHPLMRMLDALAKRNHQVWLLHLLPLSPAQVAAMLAETLGTPGDDVRALAGLVYAKTRGNPFFCLQFITALYEDGLLVFDRDTRQWRWDMAQIEARGFTDNVVDLLIGEMHKLPAVTQQAMQYASFLGNAFALSVLAAVTGRALDAIEADLWPALAIDALRRTDGQWHFMHDRMQEAAYALTPASERAARHLQIGRMLRDTASASDLDEQLFAIVTHLNNAAALIEDQLERLAIAELNVRAARKAAAAFAYAAAAGYYQAGRALLPAECWERQYALSFALAVGQARTEFLLGNTDTADALAAAALPYAHGAIDRAELQLIQINHCTLAGDVPRVLQITGACLSELGSPLPINATFDDVLIEEAQVRLLLAGRPIAALADLPLMTDRRLQIALDVALAVLPVLFQLNPILFHVLSCKGVQLTIEHGNTPASAIFYCSLGMMRGDQVGPYEEGYAYGRVAAQLVERYGWRAQRPQVYNVIGCHLNSCVRPLGAAIPLLEQAYNEAEHLGDLVYTCYSAFNLIAVRLSVGHPLGEVAADLEIKLPYVTKLGYAVFAGILKSFQVFMQSLRGQTDALGTFSSDSFDEQTYEADIPGRPLIYGVAWYYTCKLQARYLAGDYAAAREASAMVAATLPMPGQTLLPMYHFFGALTLTASFAPADMAALNTHLAYLGARADANQSSFGPMHALVVAEIARIEARDGAALIHYQQAIDGAHANGFRHHEAIANECAARYYLARGIMPVAMLYLRAARQCYEQWGADGKVLQLEQQFPALNVPSGNDDKTTSSTVAQIDALAFAKAAQAISSQIIRDKLIETLLTIVLEQAGAQRGALLLLEDDVLMLSANAAVEQQQVHVQLHTRALEHGALPHALIVYVRRTSERVLLNDARLPHPFVNDLYFRSQPPLSVLALPILRQGKLVGVLYLEHRTITYVFTSARLSVLDQLAAQAAISLENAQLYMQLEERKYTLEQTVAARTADLHTLLAEMQTTNGQLDRAVQASQRANSRLAGLLRFARFMQHEISGYAAGLEGLVPVLRAGMRAHAEAAYYRQRVDALDETVAEMKELTQRMLILTREGQLPTPQRAPVRVRALLAQVRTKALAFAARYELSLTITVTGDPAVVVAGDAVYLALACYTGLRNAIEVLGEHDSAADPAIALAVTRAGGMVVLAIRDNGPGFPAALLATIAQARAQDGELVIGWSTKAGGSGLGLALMERVAQLHGGTLALGNRADQPGAWVELRLPAYENHLL